MKLIPIGERVILRTIKSEEKTKSGIYLPKKDSDKKEGIVEEVGVAKDYQIPLKKGDHVMYTGYHNEDIEIDGEKFIIVDFKDIIARVED